jgi:hypothetical protein
LSIAEVVMNLVPSDREPLWAIGLIALLAATGVGRHQPNGADGEPNYSRDDRAVLDVGRGRFAERPSEIPARGWKDILWRVYEGIDEDRILANAGGVHSMRSWPCSQRSPLWFPLWPVCRPTDNR